jgi:selenoprotein W-related protein
MARASIFLAAFASALLASDAFQRAVPLPGRRLPPRSALGSAAGGTGTRVSIVYCTGCRWGLRSSYLAQELLTTFGDTLGGVTLIPSRPPLPGGVFLVTLDGETLWDRGLEGGFPETKQLKQRVRDRSDPGRDLGHSDVGGNAGTGTAASAGAEGCEDCPPSGGAGPGIPSEAGTPGVPHLTLSYCAESRWLSRAAWLAQETFLDLPEEVNAVTLEPIRSPAPAGSFTATLDGRVLWDRTSEGRHVEAEQLVRLIREGMAPQGDAREAGNGLDGDAMGDMDDDEAAEMRSFFGVM